MKATPPSTSELHRACICVDDGVVLDPNALPSHEVWQTDKVQEAIFFVSLAPWQLANPLITWAAVLRGAWVVEPGILTGTVAAALKYQQAIAVKRVLWFSDNVRVQHMDIWLLALEVSNQDPHRWRLLHSATCFANAKVRAQKEGRAAEVIAIVTEHEHSINCGVDKF